MANVTYSAIVIDDGRVGIGTDNPSQTSRLHVVGTHASNTQSITIGAGTNHVIKLEKADNIQSTADLFIQPYNLGDVIISNGGGNVGIGTSNPEQKMHVEGRGVFDSGVSSDILQVRNDSGGYVFGNTTNLASLDLAGTSHYRIRQGSSIPFYIGTNGYTGINDATPSHTLDVGGAIGMVYNDWFYIHNGTTYYHAFGTTNSGSYSGVGDAFCVISKSGGWHTQFIIDYDTNRVGIATKNLAQNANLTLIGNQSFGLPGNGSNNEGRYISIEGNTDAGGEGSGRIFFSEHNSSTAAMDAYGLSIGYRGGSTSIVGASGNTWTGLSAIGNGQWGFWGHDGDNTGSVIMYGDRQATYVNLANNDLNGVGNLQFNSAQTYKGYLGSIQASWDGNSSYPTLYGSNADRWVMHLNPHVSYTKNGVNGFSGSMEGATIRLNSQPVGGSYWDIGVGVCGVGEDVFAIGRGGARYFDIDSLGYHTINPSGWSSPNRHAALNIGYNGSGQTRAIDIDGGWSANESKAITWTHGSASTQIVGQIDVQHNSPGSRIRWGKLYHSGDSSTYTMELVSTSTTTADLYVKGNAIISNSIDVEGTGAFGNTVSNNTGIDINYTSSASGYGRIRFYANGTNHSTIHSFSDIWSTGIENSRGCINLDGLYGVTLGAWNNPDVIIGRAGDSYFKNRVGIRNTSPSDYSIFGAEDLVIGDNTATNAGITIAPASGPTGGYGHVKFVDGNGMGARQAGMSYNFPNSALEIFNTFGNYNITLYDTGKTEINGYGGFKIRHATGSFYQNLGTAWSSASGEWLHIQLRTVWNDTSMTMFRVTGYYPYNEYMESYFGCYRYPNSTYRYTPYGQIISHQGTWGGGSTMYNSNADPGYLVLVIYWPTPYNGVQVEHIGAGGSYGANMQHDLEIIQYAKSSSTAPIW
jgi:hypothetical protein